MSDKKVPKKLRGRETILIDPQVLRWRRRLEKEGLILGKKAETAKRKNEKQQEERSKPAPNKRRWF